MPAQTKLVRIPRPFTKGLVTDRPRWELEQQEMAAGQDVIWPRGVAVQRRPWSYTQAANPLGSTNTLGGVMAVQLSPASTDVTYVVTDVAGQVGIANTSTAQVAFTGQSTTYLPRAFYDGEVLLCPQDGVSPILRWGGLNGSLTQITNIEYSAITVSAGATTATNIEHARGSTVINGSNTTFTTQSPARSYIGFGINGNFGQCFRVDNVESNTRLTLKTSPFMLSSASSPLTLTDFTLTASPYGVLGLRVAVTEMGTATISGTDLTGQSTRWNTNGVGYGQLAAGDVIARLAQPAAGSTAAVTSAPGAGVVATVTSATAGTLVLTPSATFTTSPYVALRSMPGRDVCAHQGRLWITGVQWEPNRVYVTPPNTLGYELGQQSNGEDSYEVDFASAVQAKYIEVPDRFSDGRVVTLLSGRNVLLVLRSNNCYGIFGAWPGVTVEQIADGAGCVDVRATATSEGMMFWAGEDGIYKYVPGSGIQDITQRRVNNEWRRLMRERSSSAIVSLGMVNRHLIVSYLDGSAYSLGSGSQQSVTWVYDTVTDTWCGTASDIRARYMQTARLRGMTDDLFFIEGDPTVRKIGALAASFTDDDSTPVAGDKTPSFYAETGSILTGAATDSFRPIEMRVGYECEGIGSSLDIKTGSTEASPSATQTALVATTGDIATAKVRASTSSSTSAALGTQGRQFGMRIEAEGNPTRVAVHEVQMTAREYNNRD